MKIIYKTFFTWIIFFIQGCSAPQEEVKDEHVKLSHLAAGANIGFFLDQEIPHATDKLLFARNLQKTLENGISGSQVYWKNRLTHYDGMIMPMPTFLREDQKFCREFYFDLSHKRKTTSYKGIGCRHTNSQWEVVTTTIK